MRTATRAAPTEVGPPSTIRLAARALAFAAALVLTIASPCTRAEPVTSEYELKAALLRQLLNYVEWPDGAPRSVCIVGEDPFGPALDRAFADLGPQLRRLAASTEGLATCRIVFVARSEAAVAEQVLQRVPPIGTLSVSDIPTFAEQGGMVTMLLVERRVKFRIDAEHARRSHLRINPKLLRLAEIVGTVKVTSS